MTSKTFVDYSTPAVDAAWLNDVDEVTYEKVQHVTTVSPFMATMLDDTTAAAARTTLGAQASGSYAASGANTDITSLGTLSSVNGGQLAGFRNKLINGGMAVQQRANGIALTSAYQYGRCDRWAFKVVGGSGVAASITSIGNEASLSTGAGGGIFGSWTTGQFYATQRLEMNDVYGLSGKTITFSVKVFQDSGVSRNFRLAILKPSGLDSWGSEVVLGTSAALAVPNGVFTQLTFTMTLSAAAANSGLGVSVYDDASVALASDYILLGDAQLEIGSVATAFEQRPVGMELALCQRYYIQYAGNSGFRLDFNGSAANYQGRATFTFPVQMRTAPTMNTPTSSNTNLNSVSYAVDNAFSWYISATAAAAGNCVAAPTTAITFTSEL